MVVVNIRVIIRLSLTCLVLVNFVLFLILHCHKSHHLFSVLLAEALLLLHESFKSLITIVLVKLLQVVFLLLKLGGLKSIEMAFAFPLIKLELLDFLIHLRQIVQLLDLFVHRSLFLKFALLLFFLIHSDERSGGCGFVLPTFVLMCEIARARVDVRMVSCLLVLLNYCMLIEIRCSLHWLIRIWHSLTVSIITLLCCQDLPGSITIALSKITLSTGPPILICFQLLLYRS